MSELYVASAAVGGAVLILALFSKPIEKGLLSAPILMLGLGVFLGPAVTGLLDPHRWGDTDLIFEEAARLTLAIALMGIALRLPPGYFVRHWRSLLVLLALGMPFMWLGSSVLSYWFLEVPLLVALLIGAVLSPTDPVVSSGIVTGVVAKRTLPERLRNIISAEAGSNDGLAYPLVMLPVLLLTRPPDAAWGEWLLGSWLREVLGAVVAGILLGALAGWALRKAEALKTIEKTSFLAYTVALSLLVLGFAKLIRVDGILAVFVTGLAFDYLVSGSDRAEEENVQEAVNNFFTLPVFGLFGLMLPWQQWGELGWKAVALCAAILMLRRLPMLLLLWRVIPTLQEKKDAMFMGWFGPMGIAALFYAVLAVHHTGDERIWTVVSLVVFASILVHGITVAPLATRYRRARRAAA